MLTPCEWGKRMKTRSAPPSSVPSGQSKRVAVFSPDGERKTLLARLTLTDVVQDKGNIRLDCDSAEQLVRIRDIIERITREHLDQSDPGMSQHDRALSRWNRLLDALEQDGYGIEDIEGGDCKIEMTIDMLSGRMVGAVDGLHDFAPPDVPSARRIISSLADAFKKIPDELAQDIKRAVATGDPEEIVSAVKKGRESGAFGVMPTVRLLDSLLSIDVSRLDAEGRRLVRDIRLCTASILKRTEIAGIDAKSLLKEDAELINNEQKAQLEMVIALAEMKQGHKETALNIWRRLLKSPETLGAKGRGWTWRNIALVLERDSADARHAAKCSADAFLEAGDKKEAGASLMMLVDYLLLEDPSAAIKKVNEIIALVEQKDLYTQELRAAALHARAKRLAQLGDHPDAFADAQEAVVLRRGLIGAEDQLISSLHLAAMEAKIVGQADVAKELTDEADKLTEEVNSPHFGLAKRIIRLWEAFDKERSAELLLEAEKSGNPELIASVRVMQAVQDTDLSDTERLSLLEETLSQLDKAGTREMAKQPARYALASKLYSLNHPERAEALWREILAANPYDVPSRDALINSLWGREKWGDAAILIKKQIDLRGEAPGLMYAYGRSLLEAGDVSGAIPPLTQAIDLAPEKPDLQNLAGELRERALHMGGTVMQGAHDKLQATIAVTNEDFDRALELFSHFISAEKRMRFWCKAKGEKDHSWIEYPEKQAQDYLHTFLKARFLERVNLFEELGSGAGRLDIYVQLYGGLSLILELKMCGNGYSSSYAAAGEDQILHYMENRRSNLGYLIVFDARLEKFGQPLLQAEGPFTINCKFVDMRPRISARRRRAKS